MDKLYFEELGKYDMMMDVWGGENLGACELTSWLFKPGEAVAFSCPSRASE